MKAFKLLATLLMVLISVNFVACSDDEPAVGTSRDLIGRWTLTWTKGWEFDSDGFKDTWDEADDGENLIFKADGTGRMESKYGDEYQFNWSFENNDFKWDYSLYNGCTTKIIQLDAEKLVFEITEYYDGEIDSQEINTYKRVSSAN
ncbi:hypothetical protein H6A30_08560 [Bacteroides caecigallinarum]|uniref:hypothetical protein n=1 Tax=Bacteroides caecigallinarum TaxID=1411144 RepID=UPI00195ABEC6|nr:hypothetical protein [Bacteroides caecigallinarum]MBM6890317.1 hypothetical protein [Bacteroides caecigallinarum]